MAVGTDEGAIMPALFDVQTPLLVGRAQRSRYDGLVNPGGYR